VPVNKIRSLTIIRKKLESKNIKEYNTSYIMVMCQKIARQAIETVS